jgi:hypothetical protein
MELGWWVTGFPWWVFLAVFGGALIIFHVALVYSPWPLGKYYWEWVDYIWLTMTLFTVLGLNRTVGDWHRGALAATSAVARQRG